MTSIHTYIYYAYTDYVIGHEKNKINGHIILVVQC